MGHLLPSSLPFIANACLSLLLFIVLNISASGVGEKILRLIPNLITTPFETWLLGTSLGWGVISYGVFFLGLMHILTPTYILIWAICIILAGFKEGAALMYPISRAGIKFAQALWKDKKYIWIALSIMFIATWGLSLMMSLTPPWDYDGLMYHLEGPRRFLSHGMIYIILEIWGSNTPAIGEMMFTVGLAFGCDVFPKIVHWFFGILFSTSAYCIGKRLFNRKTGFMAFFILSAVHFLPFLASWAYIDLIWSTYDILSILALLIWLEHPEKNKAWLIICGVFLGLALGSKYLALTSLATLGILLALCLHKQPRLLVQSSVTLGSIALFIACPWYLKNLIMTGNPVYPLLFGGKGFPTEDWELLETYLHSFGAGRSFVDLLLLPINLYGRNELFVTFKGSIDIPSVLFPIAIFHPLFHRKNHLSRVIYLIIGMRVLFWFFTTQQTRFLYPVFPLLSILTAQTLQSTAKVFTRKVARVLSISLIIGQYVGTILYILIFLATSLKPWNLWFSKEETTDFLVRVMPIYEMFQTINTQVPENQKVLMLWDGRGYYCPERCLVDTEHTYWVKLGRNLQWDFERIVRFLKGKNVQYLLVGLESLNFSLHHDTKDIHQTAASYLFNIFLPRCGAVIQSNEVATLYRLTCEPLFMWPLLK